MIDLEKGLFLFHHTPPLGVAGEPTLLSLRKGGRVSRMTLQELSATCEPIITHSFHLLVDWFRAGHLQLPPAVVDLGLAMRLAVGRRRADFRNEMPWDMASMFAPYMPSRYDRKLIRAALTIHVSRPTTSLFGNLRWMVALTKSLPGLAEDIFVNLQRLGELDRFCTIEAPIYNCLLQVQERGVMIDDTLRAEFIKEAETAFISAHHELAIQRKIDVDRARSEIDYLRSLLTQGGQTGSECTECDELIELLRDSDEICGLLFRYIAERRARNVMLRSVDSDNGISYPVFEPIGTVTGRIMMVDPRFQQLPRRYRGIIVSRQNTKLVYVDYANFEPSILAAISGDLKLAELCADGKLYERLAADVFGDTALLDRVKLAFIAYSYGKSLSSLSEIVSADRAQDPELSTQIQNKFIPLFSGIEHWKVSVHENLKRESRVGTPFGNFRYRTRSGDLEARERRWAVSQIVQGTGSLILKKFILALSRSHPECELILPLHDALLLAVPVSNAQEVTREILETARQAFLEVCPNISPTVREKPFAERG